MDLRKSFEKTEIKYSKKWHQMRRLFAVVAIGVFLATTASAETIVDFEELNGFNGTPPSGTGEYFNGYGSGANADGFTSKLIMFTTNEFGPGWSYSNVNNTTTPGFTNQFAAYPSAGSNGSGGITPGSNYGLVNTGSETLADGTPTNGASLTFGQLVQLSSLDVTNTTYAYLYITDGTDGFGSPDADPNAQFSDNDFFRLRIAGFDGDAGAGNSTGVLEFDLANYGGAGTADDFALDGWQTLDLSGFGRTKSLVFSTTSSQISDLGQFGIFSDVPAYAAVDNLTFTAVPEPSGALALAGIFGWVVFRRRRRKVAA